MGRIYRDADGKSSYTARLRLGKSVDGIYRDDVDGEFDGYEVTSADSSDKDKTSELPDITE